MTCFGWRGSSSGKDGVVEKEGGSDDRLMEVEGKVEGVEMSRSKEGSRGRERAVAGRRWVDPWERLGSDVTVAARDSVVLVEEMHPFDSSLRDKSAMGIGRMNVPCFAIQPARRPSLHAPLSCAPSAPSSHWTPIHRPRGGPAKTERPKGSSRITTSAPTSCFLRLVFPRSGFCPHSPPFDPPRKAGRSGMHASSGAQVVAPPSPFSRWRRSFASGLEIHAGAVTSEVKDELCRSPNRYGVSVSREQSGLVKTVELSGREGR